MHTSPRLRLTVWSVALLLVTWIGFGDRLLTHWAFAVERGKIQANNEGLASPPDVASLEALSSTFRMVAKVATPGVVHIAVGGGRSEEASAAELERLRQLFGDELSDEQLEELSRRMRPPTAGSGIIFDKAGHILTNNHVVDGRTEFAVSLYDERVYSAELVGTDAKSDLAVLKIDAPDLHPLTFVAAHNVEVGDWVIAVGAPFGLTQTVTHGIISATGRRRVPGIDILYQDFIQTDAAINPGNSGGPLLNLRGEVVGINTAIATQGEANAGVAFTIPAYMAVRVARQLIETGTVARGWLGVSMRIEPLTDELVEIFKLPGRRGVLVEHVLADSPAQAAGVEVEDVIVGLNGTEIEGADHLRALIADLEPEHKAQFTIIRDGKKQECAVKLGLQPRELRPRATDNSTETRRVPELGLLALSLRPGLREARNVEERGVVVRGFETFEAGSASKLNIGEIILRVEGQPVTNVGELRAALQRVGDRKDVRLDVLQPDGDQRINIEVPLRPRR